MQANSAAAAVEQLRLMACQSSACTGQRYLDRLRRLRGPEPAAPIDGIRQGSVICLDIEGENFAMTSRLPEPGPQAGVFRCDLLK